MSVPLTNMDIVNTSPCSDVASTIRFDYASVEPSIAVVLQDHATAIRNELTGQLMAVISVGRRLADVKEALPHGAFGAWIASEFAWTPRTAQQYMLIAETFSTNARRVSHLPIRVLHRLAAPSAADVREAVFDRLGSGEEVDAEDVKDILLQVAANKRMAAEEARQTPKQQAREKRRRERLRQEAEQNRKNREATEEKMFAASKAAADLVRLCMPEKLPELLIHLEAADLWLFARVLANSGEIDLASSGGAP